MGIGNCNMVTYELEYVQSWDNEPEGASSSSCSTWDLYTEMVPSTGTECIRHHDHPNLQLPGNVTKSASHSPHPAQHP